MNEYFYNLAQIAVDAAAEKEITNLDRRWLYCQWAHETNQFTSRLCVEDCNFGGLTTINPTEYETENLQQPDGTLAYKHFDTPEEYASYFGHYLSGYMDGDGVQNATTLEEYIHALKFSPSGEYFGDDYQAYLSNCERIYAEEFA